MKPSLRSPLNHSSRILIIAAVATASIGAGQPPPPDLSALAAKARLEGPVAAWCRGDFRPGHSGEFAVAIRSAAGGGRYVGLQADATVIQVASFTREPDLSCYSRAEAEELNMTIAQSETIHGAVATRWDMAVVCAFVDDTTAVCWQYSPADKAFVKVGGWIT